MSKSPTKKLRERAERAEAAAIGMSFLLRKVLARYADDLGVGMTEQINQAVRDGDQIAQQRAQREAAAQQKEPAL